MIRWLQSSWFTALIGCLIYLSITLTLLTLAKFQGARAALEQTADSAAPDEPSWKFHNPEFDQWLEELRRQRDALALREQQLQELQTRLQSERQELNYATQLVSQLQAEFDKNVVRIKDQEVDNLKRQTKVLSGMSPEGAAGLLNEMAEDEAVRILVIMKPDDAGAILEALSKTGKPEAKRAAVLTERMRRTLPPASKPNAETPQ
jgi:flagellar motility protein MotE (MotC chaperone)